MPHRRTSPAPSLLAANPLAALALSGLVLAGASACMMDLPNTREERREPTDEELFELYSTTATYLYDDDSLVRAQEQAVKALEIEPDNEAMRRMIGWIRIRMGSTEDLLIAEEMFRRLRRDRDENQATLLGHATALERLGIAYDEAARRLRADDAVSEDQLEEAGGSWGRRGAGDHWQRSVKLYDATLTGR